MTIDVLQSSLEQLSTNRIRRLAGRLDVDPDIEVTVDGWRARFPMALAGFDPQSVPANRPERRFAAVSDPFANSDAKRWFPLPSAGRTARRSDVQPLVRGTNAVLACRAARGRLDKSRVRSVRQGPRGSESRS